MIDVVDKATRSRMMSGIKGKDTKPEIQVRKQLHSWGYRFRLHDRKLPGKPDLVLKKYGAAIFVHGCFWHRHECSYFKWPKTREDFWKAKINRNVENDSCNLKLLEAAGWKVCIIWECALRGAGKDTGKILLPIVPWLSGNSKFMEISG